MSLKRMESVTFGAHYLQATSSYLCGNGTHVFSLRVCKVETLAPIVQGRVYAKLV